MGTKEFFMQLSPEQIQKFKDIHERYGGLGEYDDEQVRQIASGVANYYLRVFDIYQSIKKQEINRHD